MTHVATDITGGLSDQTLYPQRFMDPIKAPCDTDIFFPPEILEEILSWIWLSPMSVDERHSFFASVRLVSTAFRTVFTRILIRDVFVTTSACHQFYRRLWGPSNTSLRDICLAHTHQIKVKSMERNYLKQTSMYNLLRTIRTIPFLPNLRSVTVDYYKDPQQVQNTSIVTPVPRPMPKLAPFTMFVVRLDLEYVFSSDTDAWILDELGLSGELNSRTKKERKPSPCRGPDLEHISVPTDTDAGPLGAFLTAAPHLQVASDEEGKIFVRILAASGNLPAECAIVHSALEPSTYVRRRMPRPSPGQPPSSGGVPTIVARGTALGFVVKEEWMKQKKRQRESAVSRSTVLNTWRSVHVLMPKMM